MPSTAPRRKITTRRLPWAGSAARSTQPERPKGRVRAAPAVIRKCRRFIMSPVHEVRAAQQQRGAQARVGAGQRLLGLRRQGGSERTAHGGLVDGNGVLADPPEIG